MVISRNSVALQLHSKIIIILGLKIQKRRVACHAKILSLFWVHGNMRHTVSFGIQTRKQTLTLPIKIRRAFSRLCDWRTLKKAFVKVALTNDIFFASLTVNLASPWKSMNSQMQFTQTFSWNRFWHSCHWSNDLFPGRSE